MTFLTQFTGVAVQATRITLQANVLNPGYTFLKTFSDAVSGAPITETFIMLGTGIEEAVSVSGKYIYTDRLTANLNLISQRDVFVLRANTSTVTHYINNSQQGEIFELTTYDPSAANSTEANVYVMNVITGKKFVLTTPVGQNVPPVWGDFDTLTTDNTVSNIDQRVSALESIQSGKAGEVIVWAGTTPPAGTLEMDGSLLSKTTYAALYAAIGDAFNTGGATALLFQLPDTRGLFLRHWDHGKGIDVGRAFGTIQTDAFQGHSFESTISGGLHNGAIPAGTPYISGNGITGTCPANARFDIVSQPPYNDSDMSVYARMVPDPFGNGLPRLSSETRPVNMAFMYCIRY